MLITSVEIMKTIDEKTERQKAARGADAIVKG